MTKNENEESVKEEFCGACLAVPIAFAGLGVANYGSRKGYKKSKQLTFWIGIITILLSLYAIYYYTKTCDQCR